jgi:hypothetical protein
MQGGQAVGLPSALLQPPASQQRTAAAAAMAMGHRSATSQFARQHFLCGRHDQIHVVGKKGTFWTLGVKIELL